MSEVVTLKRRAGLVTNLLTNATRDIPDTDLFITFSCIVIFPPNCKYYFPYNSQPATVKLYFKVSLK